MLAFLISGRCYFNLNYLLALIFFLLHYMIIFHLVAFQNIITKHQVGTKGVFLQEHFFPHLI